MATLNFETADQTVASTPIRVRATRSDVPGFCLLARLLIWCTRNAR
ncbi:hypothetical protein PQ455_09695 [Sphingomonas naphthae]|uniref:Uncharacterized protein n=1 Tax=Sphingomonas naphthae TaxID=1813468 RepID=A0ABY7TFB0_9SPHN|nr:hypothetical protein [Sphingomonas naphthae]WCT71926.1 hypothetical protein PQ455_09695 [Sphingomonas naphthae]